MGRHCYGAVCRILGIAFKALVVAYFLFCALVLGLRYVILPNIDNYKPRIERMASQALGNQVSIAAIAASWDGLHPTLALSDVVVHDAGGGEALRLPRVAATLSWLTLAVGDLRLQSLVIERPDMDVRRDAQGRLHVAGMLIDSNKPGDSRAADWVLAQREIVIRGGRLRWNDQQRGAPELALGDVNFVLRNHWRNHRFGLTASPPAALAEPFDVRGNFNHPLFSRHPSDLRRWKGELYADVGNTDLAAWTRYLDYPFQLDRGKGAVRAWLVLDNARLADVTADLSLADVSARLREDLPLLDLAQVGGRLSLREDAAPQASRDDAPFGVHGYAIAFTDFSLRTADGLALPQTTFRHGFTPARNGRPEKAEIAASRLDLQVLARFSERLPLPAAQRRMLEEFAPQGVLHELSASWQGSYPALAAYSLKTRFEGFSLKARPASGEAARGAEAAKGGKETSQPGMPGFDNLSGRIDATEKGGSLDLDSDGLALHFPGFLAEPRLPFDSLRLLASWTFQEQSQLLVDLKKLEFQQAGLSGSLTGKHWLPLQGRQGKAALGKIDVSGRLSGFEAARIGSYLPLKTPKALHDWLTGALLGGTAEDVRIRLRGDLAEFPFQAHGTGKPRGEFSIAGKIRNGRLNFDPMHVSRDGKSTAWPVLEEIKGTIAFDRARMEIRADSAKSRGVGFSNVKAVIADLATHDLRLAIDGDVAGPLQDLVGYVNDSPVAGWIGHFTEETKATGNAKVGLSLMLPLSHIVDAKVQGALQFAGNHVVLQDIMPPLSGTSGRLEFHEKGFSLNNVRASFLGGPVTVAGGSQRDGTILIKADGNATAEGLRKAYAAPAMQRLADRIGGGTRYATTIRVKNKRPEILVESSLAGISLDFPPPLRKAAGESMPLRFELNALSTGDAALLRDEMRISLGPAIGAYYERAKPAEKDGAGSWRVVRGGIGVNVPPPRPDGGLVANVSMQSLDVDAWRRVVAAIGAGAGQPAAPDSGVSAPAADTAGISQYIEPEVLAARATELIVMGKKLDNVVVGASHDQNVWQVNIDSGQASGYITWNESRSGRGLGRVTARLASLVIPQSAATDVSELLEGKDASSQMPGLDIVAENFELFGKRFGHVELQANNVRGSARREWRISKLAITNPDGQLQATGKWSALGGESVSDLSYTLDIADAGRLLERFGLAHVLRGGKGKMAGEVSWSGLPLSLDVPSLSGHLQLDLAGGQFLKVEPGAAKLLGVLNMQSIPRRLNLDFRDVFSEGFAFDKISGTAQIEQGVARTENFRMQGVTATVLIGGTADIGKESQNLHVAVLPEINLGAASVVYGLAVNPVIGIGTFLAQLFLRDPLMRAFTFEYQVTGPWKDPVVTKLVRKTPNGETASGGPSG